MKIPTTFEQWLIQRSAEIARVVFSDRLRKAITDFLLEKKLVTKSFAEMDFSSISSNNITELKRVNKIILVNIRKQLPLIKAGDAVYEIPFVEHHMRSNSIVIVIPGISRVSEINPFSISNRRRSPKILIERYFRRIKLHQFIVSNQVPLNIEVNDDYMAIGITTHSVVRIVITYSRPNTIPYSYNTVVFLIPQILKIIRTLHRKAYFKNDNVTSRA